MHASVIQHMFFMTPPLLAMVVEKVARPIVVYLFLVIALRLGGKRELAQLNPLDLVVLLTLSNTVQNAIIGDDNTVTGGLLGATTLLAINHIVVRYVYRHRAAERLIEGKPTVLIEHGEPLKRNLTEELVTHSELVSAAHKQGFKSLDDVERAVLEPGGSITFYAKNPPIEEKRHAELMARLEQVLTRLDR
ncbi:MAG: DUF421 domain-containing protein [Vicinamibacterales bacterium]